MSTILCIAGTDPSGCAGLAADQRAINALGHHAAPISTAITAQNTQRFLGFSPVGPESLSLQLDAVFEDLKIGAVKVGMLPTVRMAQALKNYLQEYASIPWVLDPVLESSTGGALVQPGMDDHLLELLPHLDLLTPNTLELARLTHSPVGSIQQAQKAAQTLLEQGAKAILVKGGHLSQNLGTDLLVTREGAWELSPTALPLSEHRRGTGCLLSSAVACYLAEGFSLLEAVKAGRFLVAQGLGHGDSPGKGNGPATAGIPRFSTLKYPVGRFHVLTDTSLQDRFSHVELAEQALAGGAEVIQMRHKSVSKVGSFLDSASELRTACLKHQKPFYLNDRIDLAGATEAQGVHLGNDDLSPLVARKLLGPKATIGLTVHSLEEAQVAQQLPVDYWGVGPVYGTQSKQLDLPALGLEKLAQICALAPVPVIAIGGIQPKNVSELLEAGAHGFAVLSAVCCTESPFEAARSFSEALKKHQER